MGTLWMPCTVGIMTGATVLAGRHARFQPMLDELVACGLGCRWPTWSLSDTILQAGSLRGSAQPVLGCTRLHSSCKQQRAGVVYDPGSFYSKELCRLAEVR